MKIEFTKLNKQRIIVLDNEIGLKLFIVNNGASLFKIVFDNKVMNLVPKQWPDFFRKDIYYSKTIGPIPNRIKDGIVTIDGKDYQMQQNEGNNTLHSGDLGLSNFVFSYNGKIQNENILAVNFILRTRKMKNGLPGNILYQVTYAIFAKENKFQILFNAHSDDDTMLSMTNHLFFTLGDSNLSDMSLTIPSHKYIESNKDNLLPIEVKEIIPCLDFQKGKKIMKDINDEYLQNHRTKGYDHCFIKDKGDKPIILENTNYKLTINSEFDSVQIYTDNYPDNVEVLTSEEKFNRGVAIEPEDNLLGDHSLKKNDDYSRLIEYKFEKKN